MGCVSYHAELSQTVDQSIHYFVEWNEKGWVQALSCVHFNMLNTVNALMGFLGFQLKMGHSPRLLPPVVKLLLVGLVGMKEAVDMASIIEQVALDVQEAKDSLAVAKITQVHYTDEPAYSVQPYTLSFLPFYYFSFIMDTPARHTTATSHATPTSLCDCLLASPHPHWSHYQLHHQTGFTYGMYM